MGDPFDVTNKFVLGGTYDGQSYNLLDKSDVLVKSIPTGIRLALFNAKFDLHWLRRELDALPELQVWDCQYAEYILSNQQWKYPSLDEACARRNLPRKTDIVKTEYWNKGIDTDAIPTDILSDYLRHDLQCTYLLYLDQVKAFQTPEHKGKYALFRLHCQDLLVLEEMEFNGYKYDTESSINAGKVLETRALELDNSILAEFDNVPINLGSPNHISTILYGGEIEVKSHVPVGEYKTGAKVGHTRYKIVTTTYKFDRLIEPLKNSGLSKDGYFSTDEDTLQNLRATGKVKRIIDTLLERRGLEKLRGTYYEGIPKLMESHQWANSLVHGQFNQCVTITGRLSATKPNQQNMTKEVKQFCISRY